MPGRGKSTHHCPLAKKGKGNCRPTGKTPPPNSKRYCVEHQMYCEVHHWTFVIEDGCLLCKKVATNIAQQLEVAEDGGEASSSTAIDCPMKSKGKCYQKWTNSEQYCEVHQNYCPDHNQKFLKESVCGQCTVAPAPTPAVQQPKVAESGKESTPASTIGVQQTKTLAGQNEPAPSSVSGVQQPKILGDEKSLTSSAAPAIQQPKALKGENELASTVTPGAQLKALEVRNEPTQIPTPSTQLKTLEDQNKPTPILASSTELKTLDDQNKPTPAPALGAQQPKVLGDGKEPTPSPALSTQQLKSLEDLNQPTSSPIPGTKQSKAIEDEDSPTSSTTGGCPREKEGDCQLKKIPGKPYCGEHQAYCSEHPGLISLKGEMCGWCILDLGYTPGTQTPGATGGENTPMPSSGAS